MPTYLNQINSNFILTQLPYASELHYDTVSVDMETGMRWSFSRRGNIGLAGYSDAIEKFFINFTNITDAEVASLLTFFRSQFGRYHSFRLLDPGGNLLQFSEDFTQTYWDKSVGVTVGASTTDPFRGSRATRLTATSGDSRMLAAVGPLDGGLSGVVVNVSVWLKAETANQMMFLGFADSTFGTVKGATFAIPVGSWKRVSFTTTLWDNNYFRVVLGSSGTWNSTVVDVFGFQVSPTKGEGAYVKTPGNYGYHQSVRFDTDSFNRQVIGPNQNAVSLPCLETSLSALVKLGTPTNIVATVWTALAHPGGYFASGRAWCPDGDITPSPNNTNYSLRSNTLNIDPTTSLSGFYIAFAVVGTVFGISQNTDFDIYDCYLTLTFPGPLIVQVRPKSVFFTGGSGWPSTDVSGSVVNINNIKDADSNPPVTFARLTRKNYSGLSTPASVTASNFGL